MAILHEYDDDFTRELAAHVGCEVTVANYADGESVVVECLTCGEVLIEFQPEAAKGEKG